MDILAFGAYSIRIDHGFLASQWHWTLDTDHVLSRHDPFTSPLRIVQAQLPVVPSVWTVHTASRTDAG